MRQYIAGIFVGVALPAAVLLGSAALGCHHEKDDGGTLPTNNAEVAKGDRILIAFEAPPDLRDSANKGTALGEIKLESQALGKLSFYPVSPDGNALMSSGEVLFLSEPLTQPMIDAMLKGGTASVSGQFALTGGTGLDSVGSDGSLDTTFGLWQKERGGKLVPLGETSHTAFRVVP